MKIYDVKAEIKHQKRDPFTFLNSFKGAVAREVSKVTIKHKLTTKLFKFKDGDTGPIAKKLIIEIDFGKAIIQPHSSFEEDFLPGIVEALQSNVNGLYENY